MINVRPSNKSDDKRYDGCNSLSIAVLEINNTQIPLCKDCLNELYQSLNKYKNTIFCKDCIYWYCSAEGLLYGGTCEYKLKMNNKNINDINYNTYGSICSTDYLDTCKHAYKRSI